LLRLSRLLLHITVSIGLVILIAWSAAALWIDGPESRALSGSLAGGLVLVALLASIFVRPWWRTAVSVCILFILALGWWLTLDASNDRDWLPDVARLPTVTIDGSQLTVHNIRNFDYRDENNYAERWETRSYDLDELIGLDMFFSFWGPTLYAHTIMSWEFSDGRHLAVSIETRKEKGEEYSAVRGFFRQFELYYVVADENDVVRLRTNYRGEKVKLYRFRASPEVTRGLLLNYVKKINKIADRPRWYNALTHNCTTTIWHHVQAIGMKYPFDWRLLANGYLIDLSYERGAVNTGLPLDELKRQSDITTQARSISGDIDFSQAIREGLPPRPSAGQ